MKAEQSRGGILAAIIELSKIRITIAVTLSTLAGYILFSGTIDQAGIWAALGVFLLASSSSALNQYQERRTDALMTRTRKRPLPTGSLNISQAITVVIVLFIAGAGILYLKTSLISLGLGLLSFFWYNGIYTPLKYRTVFALIIGSVIGAIPPLIGWTAAGGELLSSTILFLAFFLYVWQVPHFILLLLLYGNDYKEAKLPVLSTYYDEFTVRKITFVWIMGTTIAGLMLPFMCGLHYWITSIMIMALSAGLTLSMLRLLNRHHAFRVRFSFIIMNVYLVLVLVVISLDRLVR